VIHREIIVIEEIVAKVTGEGLQTTFSVSVTASTTYTLTADLAPGFI